MRFDWCKANLNTSCEEHKYDHCEMCNIARAYVHGYETAKLEKAKEIVKAYYEDACCGIFDCRNMVGDVMDTIY